MKRLLPLLLLASLAACRQEAPPQAMPAPAAGPGAVEAPDTAIETPEVAPELKDTFESDPRYLVGISYPPEANRHPGLALALHRYVQEARSGLMAAVEERPEGDSGTPYDLVLTFKTLADTPSILAIGAEGSLYTGGAHGAPLLERFVWLTAQDRLLTVEELLRPDAWSALSAFAREQLHAALSLRVDAEELEPEERARVMRSGGRMIDQGTSAEASSFRHFEPVPGAGGKLSGLRFVFPPYQVGPYSDGIQSVEVPAAVLLPHLNPDYRALFE